MIRSAIAILALTASATLAIAATDDELRQQIVGAWGQDAACENGSLTFKDDGTFAFLQPGGAALGGTWTITDGVLSGSRDGGGSQPDTTISFADGRMTMTETAEPNRSAVFQPCPG
jgi:hypothetical protein